MVKVYPTKMKSMKAMHKEFNTLAEAEAYVATRNNPDNYTIEPDVSVKAPETSLETPKAEKTNWKTGLDFTGAVEITRDNVKHFYNKEGFIQVVNPAGNVLHIGKTTNMGKVFSNYVNCANYTQSYDFNLAAGDKLYFKEAVTK